MGKIISARTHILVHSELPLPPGELTDGDDGGEGDARDEHHVEPRQRRHAHLVRASCPCALKLFPEFINIGGLDQYWKKIKWINASPHRA